MPKPVPDHSTGWWSIRVRMPDGRRKKFMLAKQDGWTPGKKLPKKPPPDVELLARKYQDMDLRIRHGVDVQAVRTDDLKMFFTEYQEVYALDRRPNSIRILKQAIDHFLKWCDARGIKTVQAVTSGVCDEYLRSRRKGGTARSTLLTDRGCLAPAWSRAVRTKQVTENPWKLTTIPGKPNKTEPEFWTVEELARLVNAASGWVKNLIVVASHTGGRMDSIVKLKWTDLNFEKGIIHLDSKTGKYTVPMNDVVRDAFTDSHEGNKSKYVFPNRDGTGHRSRAVTYTAIMRLTAKCGLPMKGRYCHILRHTFASHAIMQGKPLVVVSKWLGHASIHMTMRYAHLAQAESQKHMEGFSIIPEQAPAPVPPPVVSSEARAEPPCDQTGTFAPQPEPLADSPPSPPLPSEES